MNYPCIDPAVIDTQFLPTIITALSTIESMRINY